MNKQKYIIKNNPQGSDEWLQDRLGHLTGSDAQAIAAAGKGLESVVFERVAELLTGKSKDQYINNDLQRGNELEPMGRNCFEIERGVPVKQVGFIELNKNVGASIDGFIGEEGIFELKCPNDANFVRYMYEKKINTKYVWQVQHYLYVTGRKWVDFCTFNPNFSTPLIIERVKIDAQAQEKLKIGINIGVNKIEEIWQKIQ